MKIRLLPVGGNADCSEIEPGDEPPTLARGNAQVHDADGGSSSRRTSRNMSFKRALKLAGLR